MAGGAQSPTSVTLLLRIKDDGDIVGKAIGTHERNPSQVPPVPTIAWRNGEEPGTDR